ncbi:acyltransferase family protein [Asticcacaulis sp. EMRT-3]|uniref:acyltransferase family protein n=1 Tax=Asticcacaulis sp. EMRT-3 TaxID=3040349 RepID=UPI0024AFD98A|nr:acyltransferase family protein [Asticcacaulis sp. EMRT-3]MDI7775235.1 acyltransferase family protein [Asticcacaulis sp. EMRT-3]
MTETGSKRADIQGLRGVAVLAVLGFHAFRGAVPGGFAGVDIFFVISGFLITRILLDGMEGGSFRLRDFYKRRIRRLFPALYGMLFAVLAAGLIILPPRLLSELVYTQFFTTLFASNFAFAHLSGYFDTQASLKPLLHTWSLGVEEQFYLAFPVILLVIRRFAARFLWPILAGLALLSLLAAMLTPGDAAFYWPTTRAFELLIGALCLPLQTYAATPARQHWLSVTGLVLIVASLALLNADLPFPGLYALPPCLGAACLLISAEGYGNRLIAAPPLVMAGNVSYSLYLWHWPLLVYGRMVLGEHLWVSVTALVLALAIAFLSWRFIEQPALKYAWPRGRLWGLAAALMAASVLPCLLIFAGHGLPQRFSLREQTALAAAQDFSPDRKRCHLATGAQRAYADTCVLGTKGAASLAVWGDSEGVELAEALGESGMGVRQITASACPPSLGFRIAYNPACRAHNADTLLHLKADPAIKTVVLIANFDRYADAAAMTGGLELSALDLSHAGKAVVIIAPLPVYNFDPPSAVGLYMRLGRDPRDLGQARVAFDAAHAAISAELQGFTAAHGMRLIRPADSFCDERLCHVYAARIGVLYFNGQHLSMAGARVLAAAITTKILLHRAK